MTTCSFIKTVSKCDSQLKVMIERMQRGSDGVQCDWTLFPWLWEQQELSLNWFLSTVNSKAITRVNCARLDAIVPPR